MLYMARAESSALAEGENASAKAEDFVFSGYAPLEVPAKGGVVASGGLLLTGYSEAGRRSQAEDFAEEDTDEDYGYQNYHLKFEQRISKRLNYDVSSFVYRKDYKTRDSLDNISRIFKAGLAYDLKRLGDERIKFDFKLKSRQKRYKNNPAGEYD